MKEFKLIAHSSQIADTGDYDGHWRITNGEFSLLTCDDADEGDLQKIVDALNSCGCEFMIPEMDAYDFERHHFKFERDSMGAVLKEAVEYLDQNELNSIQSTSILHNKMKEAYERTTD